MVSILNRVARKIFAIIVDCSVNISYLIGYFTILRPIFLAVLGTIFLNSSFEKNRTSSKNFTIEQLAPGVWAAIQNDNGGHAISNAGIVDLGDKTIVFDAFINQDAALELKNAAEELTKHPVTILINSHYHDDHIRGNMAFAPAATIISTEWTKNEMKKSEPEEQEWARNNIEGHVTNAKQQLQNANADEKKEALMWLGYYEAISQSLSTLKTVLPSRTFSDSLRIHGTKRSVLLIECKNGHTGSDAVMELPAEGIVFMGDLLFVQRHPWLSDGDPDSWKKHLRSFLADPMLKKFVPGHGPVSDKNSLTIVIDYINELQKLAADAYKNGITDTVFAKHEILPKYKSWWYGRFYSGNLSFLYDREKSKK